MDRLFVRAALAPNLHQYNLCTNLWHLANAVRVNLTAPADDALDVLGAAESGVFAFAGIPPLKRNWSVRIRGAVWLLMFLGPIEHFARVLIGLHSMIAARAKSLPSTERS